MLRLCTSSSSSLPKATSTSIRCNLEEPADGRQNHSKRSVLVAGVVRLPVSAFRTVRVGKHYTDVSEQTVQEAAYEHFRGR